MAIVNEKRLMWNTFTFVFLLFCSGNIDNLIRVSDVLFGTSDEQFTPSNTVLQGRCSIVQRQGKASFM